MVHHRTVSDCSISAHYERQPFRKRYQVIPILIKRVIVCGVKVTTYAREPRHIINDEQCFPLANCVQCTRLAPSKWAHRHKCTKLRASPSNRNNSIGTSDWSINWYANINGTQTSEMDSAMPHWSVWQWWQIRHHLAREYLHTTTCE